jgi:hypothetical protein
MNSELRKRGVRQRLPHLLLSLLASCAAAAVGPAALAGDVPATARQMVDEIVRQYPPGSITTPELADKALSDARTVHARLQVDFDAQRRHCAGVFFVNRCMDAARRSQRNGEHEVNALTLEAHDLQRHRDALAHADSRAQTLRQQAADDLLRPERERQATLAARTREQNASAREEDEKRDLARAAQDSVASDARAREHNADVARKDALRPRQETASQREFREKQDQAAAYAKTRAQDREANAKRRTERETARAAAAAEHPGTPPSRPPATVPAPAAPGPR